MRPFAVATINTIEALDTALPEVAAALQTVVHEDQHAELADAMDDSESALQEYARWLQSRTGWE